MEKKKVLVGMSGGVDSSAAALLLLENGYDVTGCTLKLFNSSDLGDDYPEGKCCSLDDVSDAKSVCRKIGIDHLVFNFTENFKKFVMDDFVKSYVSGETPNPCIRCNTFLKFGMMLDRARLLGFDYIATGHYAKRVFDEETERYLLKKSHDDKKDQTYVLYTMTQDALKHTLFPLSDMTKPEVREFAASHGFVNSSKPDSEDICFVPEGKYTDFIERYSGYTPTKGNFINSKGEILGTHEGIINYTIGQRRGLGVTFGKPVFVTEKNAHNNTVTLGGSEELMKNEILVSDVNLISIETLNTPMKVTAKARYNMKPQSAVICPVRDKVIKVLFDSPVRAAAPGQACVFYDKDTVVGGGKII